MSPRPLAATAAAAVVSAAAVAAMLPSASAAPGGPVPAGTAITGVPSACPQTHPWPTGASQRDILRQLSANTGIQLTGGQWKSAQYLPMVKVVWQTLEGLGCTDYVRHVMMLHPGFTLNAAPISGYAWGDWGLTRAGATTLDFGKWTQALKAGDSGRMVRILVHELGHAWDADRDASTYWPAYLRLQKSQGAISDYGRRSVDENFSEIVGYYVARCAKDNPYDTGRFDAYYAFVKQTVFGGREFGPAPGTRVDCSAGSTDTSGGSSGTPSATGLATAAPNLLSPGD